MKEVRDKLQSDDTLTSRQKEFIKGSAFDDALRDGMKICRIKIVEGDFWGLRPENVTIKNNFWCWNEQADTLWLYKWGDYQ